MRGNRHDGPFRNPGIEEGQIELHQPAHFDEGDPPLADHGVDRMDREAHVHTAVLDTHEARPYGLSLKLS